MHIKFYRRNTEPWNKPFFRTGWLPIHQRIVIVGPIAIHIAWGESAKLIKTL